MKKIIIIGGGIAGLSLAYYLRKTHDIILLEKENRVGGWIRTVKKEGFVFEEGPKNFRLDKKGRQTLKLVQDLDLETVQINLKKRFLFLEGKLQRLSPLLFLKKGGLKILLKRFQNNLDDESVYDFCIRNMGKEMTETFIDPMVKGIYGGSLDISLKASFPYQLKRSSFLFQRSTPWLTLQEGMEALPIKLSQKLDSIIRKDHQVNKVLPKGKQFEVETKQGTFLADHVVFAIPSHVVAKILGIDFLEKMPFQSITRLFLGFDEPLFENKGFGYLVPSKEKEPILGMTWDSKSSCCLNFSNEISEKEALTISRDILKRHLSITTKPIVHHHFIAKNAIPQYRVGHFKILERLKELPFTFLGNSFYGVGINDCVHSSAAQLESVCLQ